eukprot:CAMPEP_0177621826 /NCGR_PEP_ID=MMETSP0419_2-20121207/27828_1 /TAXON_ID=582737 /ORGANISM="Tetraselmis sp., Strain GSL018" /LENGTH=353 /DNA_ID=CAMNT_0019121841 /DNA_START=800 /DNA_END=1861 /DNA_ORIENTATION=-
MLCCQVWVQVSLLGLLFGTTCGSISVLSDVGSLLMKRLDHRMPQLLSASGGTGIQLLLVAVLVLPLCLLRDIRSLDQCAPASAVVIAVLVGVIVHGSLSEGLPAIRTRDLPIFAPSDPRSLPEAVSLFGFAFYLHPCLIPVLREMPSGAEGLRATVAATRAVLYVVCVAVYGAVGLFGAAWFGTDTQGDILENDFIPGRLAVVLVAAVAAYLAVTIPPIFHVLRTSFSELVAPGAGFSWGRHVAETVGLLAAAVGVTLSFSEGSEKIFAITGSTGVCMACYVLPIAIYRRGQRTGWRRGFGTDGPLKEATSPLLEGAASVSSAYEDVACLLIATVGAATSAAALWTSLAGDGQ